MSVQLGPGYVLFNQTAGEMQHLLAAYILVVRLTDLGSAQHSKCDVVTANLAGCAVGLAGLDSMHSVTSFQPV